MSKSQDGRRRSRPSPPAEAEQHAHKIADAVEQVWHRVHGAGRLEVPMAVVATLASVPPRDLIGRDSVEVLAGYSLDEFAQFARNTWRAVIRARPDIIHLVYPLIAWLFDHQEPDRWEQANDVAMAALEAGQLDLTGTDRRREVDLLGAVLTVLRPKGELEAGGQFYTPADVSMLIAGMATNVTEHSSVMDPAMGTGGMFRAIAETMREQGLDPRTVTWVGCDIDEMAVACATVSSMSWDLGHDIVFHVGDTLLGDWEAQAVARRREIRRIISEVIRDQTILRFLRRP